MLGGTGFVGHSIATRLCELGHRVRILTHRRERHRDLLVLPTVQLVQGDVHELGFLRSQLQDMDAVINLVGILNKRRGRGGSFEEAHVELPRKIMEAAKQTRVKRYLHMSALGASSKGPSEYLRTKGIAEDMVHSMAKMAGFTATSFRPSVIFGRDDSFTNRFANLLRSVPLVFPLACPQSRFQPVFVDDVAHCFIAALNERDCIDQRYNLCGPSNYSLREIVSYIDQLIDTHRRILGLADWQARIQAALMEWLPGTPFSRDNYRSLQLDSTCDGPFPQIFDITPKTMEQVVPTYLRPQRDHLDQFRSVAGR